MGSPPSAQLEYARDEPVTKPDCSKRGEMTMSSSSGPSAPLASYVPAVVASSCSGIVSTPAATWMPSPRLLTTAQYQPPPVVLKFDNSNVGSKSARHLEAIY